VAEGTRSTGLWRRAFPRFPETVAVEVYRQIARTRFFAAMMCIGFNALTLATADAVGLHRDRFVAMQIPNNTLILSTALLGLLMWKRALSPRTLRRITFVCVTLEMASVTINLSLYGSLGSYMTLVALTMAMIYRVMFDFRIGAWASGLLIGGFVIVIALESAGVMRPQFGFAATPDTVYQDPVRQLMIAPFLMCFMILAFWGANWAMVRLHHKDRAIRILRETLAANEQGKVGRHTGRTLRDTYAVGALIGVGGMGEVYRGQHQRTRRTVAIKLLHPHLVDDPVLLARFRREAEIAGSVDSAHIVEVIDADLDDGQPFLVMELLEGDSLADLIQREGALPPARAAAIVEQVATGLAAAHDAQVVHRDLKPENIVIAEVDGARRVKILDFGISKIRGNATAITNDVAILGTPDFMSPEQALGRTDHVDHRSDIFSLGALVYYALSGHRPFQASSVPAMLRRICDEEPPPLATRLRDGGPVATQLAAVVGIAMAKRPAQRYGTALELAADLTRAAAGALPAEVIARFDAVDRARPASHSAGDASVDATQATAHA
jgi:tRNA A-37 threonylcarbamoyl transferase component Bud32